MSPKKQINLKVTEAELEILKQYCEQEGRQQSELIREYIRSLKRRILDSAD
jgi:hypothetical protein